MKTYIYLIILLTLYSCSSYKKDLFASGNKEQARINVIKDFIHRQKNKKTFEINELLKENDSLYIFYIPIYKKEHKEQSIFYKEGEYSLRFPSRYLILNDFLFYWTDSTRATSKEVYDIMLKFNTLDTIKKTYYTPDSNLKTSYWYFICKNNLKNYKVIKKLWVKDYEYPNINCK